MEAIIHSNFSEFARLTFLLEFLKIRSLRQIWCNKSLQQKNLLKKLFRISLVLKNKFSNLLKTTLSQAPNPSWKGRITIKMQRPSSRKLLQADKCWRIRRCVCSNSKRTSSRHLSKTRGRKNLTQKNKFRQIKKPSHWFRKKNQRRNVQLRSNRRQWRSWSQWWPATGGRSKL